MQGLNASNVRRLATLIGFGLATAGLSAQTLQPAAAVLAQLRSGGLVIIMRHASSPAQLPDAAHADAANTGHERQLDEAGRQAAQNMGAAIRALGIPIGEVLCSPTYRARETVRLAGLGKPTIEPRLDEPANAMQAAADTRRGQWLRDQAAQQPAAHTDRVLVTHMPNIRNAFSQIGDPPKEGEALIFKPDGHGGTELIGRVPMSDWLLLKTP